MKSFVPLYYKNQENVFCKRIQYRKEFNKRAKKMVIKTLQNKF